MNFRLKVKPIASALLSMAVCTAMAVAQDTSNSNNQANAKKSAPAGTALPDLIELDPFGGISLFGQVNRGLDPKHISGGAFGGRVGANVSDHFGLELMYEYTE